MQGNWVDDETLISHCKNNDSQNITATNSWFFSLQTLCKNDILFFVTTIYNEILARGLNCSAVAEQVAEVKEKIKE